MEPINEISPGMMAIDLFNKVLPFANPYTYEVNRKGELNFTKAHMVLSTRCLVLLMIDQIINAYPVNHDKWTAAMQYWHSVKECVKQINDISDNLIP